jgi:hypothetical protein
MRWRGPKAGWLGALAGAGPDLLYFVPSRIEQVAEGGWSHLWVGRDPAIWRANGPPMPRELVEAYNHYYVYTHSLVFLGLAVLLFLLSCPGSGRGQAGGVGRRQWCWYAIPYGLHIVMDVPTHERYLTQAFYPLSSWSFEGLSWTDPRIFWPNWGALILVYAWLWARVIRRRGS